MDSTNKGLVAAIDALAQTAINKDAPAGVVHNVSTGEIVHTPKRRLCVKCGKTYASYQSLWKHKKRICKRSNKPVGQVVSNYKYVKPIILKWNGTSWETRSKNITYQMNLGRDLSNLLERGAIKDDALNSCQREYIQMYKTLFKSVEDEF